MGFGSAIWNIVGNQSPSEKKFDIYMTNYNAWNWAKSDYESFTTQSVMNVGTFSTNYISTMASSTFSPRSSGSYLFELTEFGFGKTDEVAQTEYYEDLKNTDDAAYGYWANSTSLALNFRGLGLPTSEFKKFENLLSIITMGESTCVNAKSGYCVLTSTCDKYASMGLWDYDFKM